MWRSVIKVSDSKDDERSGTETLKNHRHDECSQVITTVIHLYTGAPVTGVITGTLIVMLNVSVEKKLAGVLGHMLKWRGSEKKMQEKRLAFQKEI